MRIATLFAFPGLYGRNHNFRPHFEGDGDGGGLGAEGQGGVGAGGEGAAGAEPQPHEFKDLNGSVRVPGFKDPIKLSDLVSSHNTRGQHEASLKVMAEVAKILHAQQQQAGKKQPPVKPQATPEDPFADIRGAQVLDGETMAKFMEKFQNGSLKEMQQAMAGMAKIIQGLQQGDQTVRRERGEADFTGHTSKAIEALGLPANIEGGTDAVNEMIRDFAYSFDDASLPQLLQGGELAKQFKERFEKSAKFFRAYEKAQLAAAQQRAKQRIFQRPGAGTPGNGQPRKLLSNRERAAALFSTSPAE